MSVAENYDDALDQLEHEHPDFAVLDLKMPGKSGMDLLADVKQLSPNTKTVILTGYGSITNAVEAIKLGAANYVTKPVDAEQLLHALGEEQPAVSTQSEFPPPSLAEAEWQHIQRVLADTGGNISEAARRLDIPRRTLQRKLKKMAP